MSMSEKVTVTLTLEQAEALVDAATCLAVAADRDIADLISIYTPARGPETAASDRYKVNQANLAQSGAQLLRKELDGVYARDPELQDLLHRFKMHRKYEGDR
jgi:hypothetical protein